MRPLKPDYTAALRRRRLLRYSAFVLLFVFLLIILLDHLGAFGYRGDDSSRFDGRSFTVTSISDHGSLAIGDTEVRLLGVEVPATDQYWAREADAYLSEHLAGKTIILRLGPLETRDAAKRLLAYVHLTETDCFNVDIVREGNAYADRRQTHAMHAPIEAAETDARKHMRGLWKDLKFSQMPAWRQTWLKEHRRSTTQNTEEIH